MRPSYITYGPVYHPGRHCHRCTNQRRGNISRKSAFISAVSTSIKVSKRTNRNEVTQAPSQDTTHGPGIRVEKRNKSQIPQTGYTRRKTEPDRKSHRPGILAEKQKQKQVAGPSWTPQSKLHPDLHREIATASTPRERAEQSDGSEAHQQCWRSRAEVEVPKSRKCRKLVSADWEPRGRKQRAKVRVQLGDRSGETTSDGHARSEFQPRPPKKRHRTKARRRGVLKRAPKPGDPGCALPARPTIRAIGTVRVLEEGC